MTDQEIANLVQGKLIPFMSRFEQDNRGGRISLEFIQGLGIILEKYMVEVVREILKGEQKLDEKNM